MKEDYVGSLPSDQFEDEWDDMFSVDREGKVHLRLTPKKRRKNKVKDNLDQVTDELTGL